MKKLTLIILLILPSFIFGQVNLDFDVYNYMYYDSLGNYFSEKEYAENGVKGSYDKLIVRTDGVITTFTFNLREDNPKRTDQNLTEVYHYLVAGYHKDEEVEVWKLEKDDGVVLTFTHEFFLNTYMLAIPANKVNKERYLYIFSIAKM